jgi:hypothetical protein
MTMTPLTRFLAFHALIGFGIAVLFSGMLFGFDIAGLRTLVAGSQVGFIAASALTFMLCLTFGSIQMGIAIMQLDQKDNTPRGGRLRFATLRMPQGAVVMQPVRVRSRSR